MELFGRELSLEQMVGLVECNATPDEDLVHRAALEIIAALRESQRRERAAVEDMARMNVADMHSSLEFCMFCKHGEDKRCKRCDFRTMKSGFEWRGSCEVKDEAMEDDSLRWCAFSGDTNCPILNEEEDAYCKESLLKGYCKRKHPLHIKNGPQEAGEGEAHD